MSIAEYAVGDARAYHGPKVWCDACDKQVSNTMIVGGKLYAECHGETEEHMWNIPAFAAGMVGTLHMFKGTAAKLKAKGIATHYAKRSRTRHAARRNGWKLDANNH